MTEPATIALTALGHTRVENDRCTAVRKAAPESARGPGSPPEWCGLKAGHEGPHYHIYGTSRYMMDERRIEHNPLRDVCKKCRTIWPCKDAEKVLAAFNTQ